MAADANIRNDAIEPETYRRGLDAALKEDLRAFIAARFVPEDIAEHAVLNRTAALCDDYDEPHDSAAAFRAVATCGAAPCMAPAPSAAPTPRKPASAPKRSVRNDAMGLKQWLDGVDEPFSTTLLRLIDERGFSDVDVYKRAGMSRQLFSRIRSDAGYRPAKKTVLALAVALRLSAKEARDLLERAGFALSRSDKRDLVVEYFLENGMYDLMALNQALYEFDQPLL